MSDTRQGLSYDLLQALSADGIIHAQRSSKAFGVQMLMMKKCILGVVAAAAMLATTASAQDIKVTVDGDPVAFRAAQPQMMNGRILVPLRGVMEKLGAFIKWEPSTSTVFAQAGSREIELKIGADIAKVNGTEVLLDQPALVLRGTTMVPLRFMGEALGAEVKWDGSTRTVMILTGGNTGGGNTGGGSAGGGSTGGDTGGGNTGGSTAVNIAGFTVKANAWAKGEEIVAVTMNGTPGGQAYFTIPGVVEQVAMRETSAGVYAGEYKIPAQTAKVITVSGATVVGSLKVGSNERLIQHGTALNIDNQKPRITALTPENGVRIEERRPSISAVLSDEAGSGINKNKVLVMVDGVNVTSKATITENFVVYKPDKDLDKKLIKASIRVEDKAGNAIASIWEFTVGDQITAVKTFTHNGNRKLEPGDVITFTVTGDQGAQAVVTFQISGREVPLRENPKGTYKGEYVVRRVDNLAGETVILTFDPNNASKVTVEAKEKVGVASPVPTATLNTPVVTNLKDGQNVKNSFIVEGTALGAKKVEIVISYRTVVLGGLPLTGVLSQMSIETDKDGKFSSDAVDLSFRMKGKDTEYTIEVIGVDANGKQSQATTLKVREN